MMCKVCSVCSSELADRLWVRLTRQKSIRDRERGLRLQLALGQAGAKTESQPEASFSPTLPSPTVSGSQSPQHFTGFGVSWVPEACQVKLILTLGANTPDMHQVLALAVWMWMSSSLYRIGT